MKEFPYLAKDVAKLLGHTHTTMMLKFADENEKIIKTTFSGGQNRNMLFLSSKGVIQIISKSRKLSSSEKENLINQFTDEKIVYVGGAKEIEFISKLEPMLKVFGISEYVRQHNVSGKRIDLYLPQVNVAIEYDENDHAGYSYNDQEGRQELIESELNCTFIRVSDSKDDETNCAIVLKELLNLKKVS